MSETRTTFADCESAIARLKACHERELATYGEAGLQEVKEMEDEAPAPTPCVDEYNAVVLALADYDGSPEEFELGELKDTVHALLAAQKR